MRWHPKGYGGQRRDPDQVKRDGWREQGEAVLLRQGYLSSHPERVVRVRIEGDGAVMTIKSKAVGVTRGEWEYPLPLQDAAEFLDRLCEQPVIVERRLGTLARTIASHME